VKFKVGDLVRVKDSTDDQNIPESRCGLIMERYSTRPDEKHMRYTDIWNVLLTNGNILRFHEMFLDKISEEEYEKED
jgi:ketosteroid isomerase-like protein